MLKRVLQSVTEYCRVLQSDTECCRVSQSDTECYRVLQSVTECYRVLQSVTKCYRVLQSVTEYYRVFLAHLLRPIFGLVLLMIDIFLLENDLIKYNRKKSIQQKKHIRKFPIILIE